MSNKNSICAFQYVNDDEWYTTKEDIQYFINMANIPKNKVIWCPFDLMTSNFVTVLQNNGYHVIYSHITLGSDFYKYQPSEKWDLIISNPPFKNKCHVLKRLLEFGKDRSWALIFGIQCLNSGSFCDQLQNFSRPQYVHLKKRMRFTKDHLNYDVMNLKQPSFASMWVCNNLFNKDIQVWTGANYKKQQRIERKINKNSW